MPDQRDANAFGNLAPGIDSGVIETRQSGSWSSRSNEFRSLFGNPLASSLKSIHPPTELILFLWQRYLESVDSVLKILHPSKVQRQIIGFVRDRDALDPSMHCLIFAIYYAAVITMTAEECEIVFKEGKKGILSRYVSRLLNCQYILTLLQGTGPESKALFRKSNSWIHRTWMYYKHLSYTLCVS